jgi:hypothetical protein
LQDYAARQWLADVSAFILGNGATLLEHVRATAVPNGRGTIPTFVMAKCEAPGGIERRARRRPGQEPTFGTQALRTPASAPFSREGFDPEHADTWFDRSGNPAGTQNNVSS